MLTRVDDAVGRRGAWDNQFGTLLARLALCVWPVWASSVFILLPRADTSSSSAQSELVLFTLAGKVKEIGLGASPDALRPRPHRPGPAPNAFGPNSVFALLPAPGRPDRTTTERGGASLLVSKWLSVRAFFNLRDRSLRKG